MILFLLLSFTTLAAQGADVRSLDLQLAVELAVKQNLNLRIEELNLEKSKLNYEKQKASNLLNQSRYSELQAEYNLAVANNNYNNVYDNLVKNTVSQYTNLLLKKLDLEIKEKNLALEKRKLAEARAKYNIGDIGSVELLEQENTYKDAQFNLETARDDYQQSIKEFKTLIGCKASELEIIDLESPQVWEIEEKKALNTALKNSIELELKNKKLELARIDKKRSEVSAPKLDKQIKEISYKVALLQKENSREEIVNSTQETYYKFKQVVKNMKLKKERLAEAQEKYKLRKKQYDAGLITKIDVLQYEVNMMETKYQYHSAISNYYLQEHSLKQTMKLETGVFSNGNIEEK